MDPLIKIVIGQILGIIATILSFVSYQMNTKKRLIMFSTLGTLATCLSFFFLEAWSGFALNIVCIVRNIMFYFLDEKSKANYISASVLALIMVVLGVFSWQGPVSLLAIIPLAANTVFMSFGNPQLLRKSILFTSTALMLYNVFVFSLGGIANEAVAVGSSVIGIIRFRQKKADQKAS